MLDQAFYDFVQALNPNDINSATGFNLPATDVQTLTQAYRTSKQLTRSPAHFIGIDALNALCKTPGLLGINIYPGQTDTGTEVLIALPAGIINGEFQDILNSSFTINTLAATHNLEYVVCRPCPPCPKLNSVNS